MPSVRGYLRRSEHGRIEEVGPTERLEGQAAHDHIGLPAKLDKPTWDTMIRYRHNAYNQINAYLRTGSPDSEFAGPSPMSKGDVQAHIARMDGAFAQQKPLGKPIAVYRGFGHHASADEIRPGDVISDKAFLSTSTDPGIAMRGFTAEGSSVVRIHVPAGVRAISQSNLLRSRVQHSLHLPWAATEPFDEEHEVLLPRNGRLRVTHVERGGAGHGRDLMDAEWLA